MNVVSEARKVITANAGDQHDSETSTNNRNHEETLVSNDFDPKRSLFLFTDSDWGSNG